MNNLNDEVNNFHEENLNDENNNINNYDSHINQNYVKQSFDKLIYLHDNLDYQKYYLNEIEKPGEKILENNYEEKQLNSNSNQHLKKKRKRKANKESNKLKDFSNNFCDSNCLEKFNSLIYKIKEGKISETNKKILEIFQLITEIKNNDEKFTKLYNFIKDEFIN